jgi:hypothetical protein
MITQFHARRNKMSKCKYPFEENPRGHIWRLDEYGEIDLFGLDYDNHNGPICVVCEDSFCHHCQAGPDNDCPGPIDHSHDGKLVWVCEECTKEDNAWKTCYSCGKSNPNA